MVYNCTHTTVCIKRCACDRCDFTPIHIITRIKTQKITDGENIELVKKYGIRQAPTLVVADGETAETYVNASNIKKFVG